MEEETVPINPDLKPDFHKEIRFQLSQIQDWDPNSYQFTLPELSELPTLDKPLSFDKAFDKPGINEKQKLAIDELGNQLYLNQEQLQQIRKTGEFTVESQEFPDQVYRWAINIGFQKGTDKIKDTLIKGIAFGTEQFIINIPNRIWKGHYISIWHSIKSFTFGFLNLIALPFGSLDSEKRMVNNESTLNKIRTNILFDILGNECIQRQESNEIWYETEDGLRIRLFNASDFEVPDTLSDRFTTFMKDIKDRQLNNRAFILEQMKQEFPNLSDNLIKQKLADVEVEEQQRLIADFLRENLDKNVCLKIIELMASIWLIRTAQKDKNEERDNALNIFITDIKAKHWIKSRINDWYNNQISSFTEKWEKQHPLINYINKYDTNGTLYLLRQNLSIIESPDYVSQVNKYERVADETFNWSYRYWLPSSWQIKITGTPENPFYSVDKYKRLTTTSKYPGWRIINLFLQASTIINNGAFYCFANAFYGPFGIRSIFGINAFQPDKTIDQRTGTLISTGRSFNTWFGRIKSLWSNIISCRKEFNEKPDIGVFGKSIVNPFNWFWNYICKGVIGTLVTFVGHPILTLISTPLSIILFLTSPFWGFGFSLIKYLFDILIYDTDSVSGFFPLFRYLIWEIMLKGLGQFILSILGIIGAGLLGSVIGYFGSVLRFCGRSVYDAMIYSLFIKRFGRIPQADSFTARLISGPGLASSYYYQVDVETVRLLLLIELSKKEMNAYSKQEGKKIDQPLNTYSEFLDSFSDHGLIKDSSHSVLNNFKKNNQLIKDKLDTLIKEQWVKQGLKNYERQFSAYSCRLTKNDLIIVLENATTLCQNFYQNRIFKYMDQQDIYDIWFNLNIAENDWLALTKKLLISIFSSSILQPIEEVDNAGFKLVVQHINTKSYFKEMWAGSINDDLALVTIKEPTINQEQNDTVITLPSPTRILITPKDINYIQNQYERYLFLTSKDYDIFLAQKAPQILLEKN